MPRFGEIQFLDLEPYIRGIPLKVGRKYVKIALLEVGFRPKRKRSQLVKKDSDFQANVRRQFDRSLDIYRGVVHYQPSTPPYLDIKGYEIDFLICYTRMTPRMLEQMNYYDKKILMAYVDDDNEYKEDLREMLCHNDADSLESLLRCCDHNEGFSGFKGRIAEQMAFHDIRKKLPLGVNFLDNKRFFYREDGERRFTEVDGIFTFYDLKHFLPLFPALGKYNSLEISLSDRWAKMIGNPKA